MNSLSAQRLQFIDAYLQHGNATRAYVEAGYSPRSADANAAHLIKRPAVQAEIERRQNEVRAVSTLTLQTALEVLSTIAQSPTSKDRDKVTAIMAWARMTGQDQPKAPDQGKGDVLAILRAAVENGARERQGQIWEQVEELETIEVRALPLP